MVKDKETPQRVKVLRLTKKLVDKIFLLKKEVETVQPQVESLSEKDAKWFEKQMKKYMNKKYPGMDDYISF